MDVILRRPVKFKPFLLLVLLGLLLMGLPVSHAQEVVVLGQDKVGEISAANAAPFYTYAAQANEQVIVRVSAVASPVIPQFTVFNSSSVLVQAIGNPNLSSSIEAVVTFPSAGNYAIQVVSVDGSVGQFVLSVLSNKPAVPPTPLLLGQPVQAILAPATTVAYSFGGDPNQPLLLELAAVDSLQNVSAELTDSTGEVVAILNAKVLRGSLLLPAGVATYVLTLTHDTPNVPNITFALSLTPQEAAADEETLAELPTSGPCVLATQQAIEVNVRANPIADATIRATILPTETYPVIGRNGDSSWYQISYIGGSGWVSAAVTRRGGDCRNVGVTATLVPTATITPTINTTATTSVTPNTSQTATATPTITVTPGGPSDTPSSTPTITPSFTPSSTP